MSTYVVCTKVPVFVTIDVEDGEASVRSVVADDSAIPGTVEAVLKSGGTVEDENGLTVKPEYSDGTKDPDWDLMTGAYDDSEWPSWDFGF